MRYGAGLPIAGEFQNGSQLANGGESLILVNASLPAGSQIVRSFRYDDEAPWPEAPDGEGYSLTLIGAESNPDPALAASWRSSVAIGGSPGGGDGVSLEVYLAAHGLVAGDEGADADGDGLSTLLEYAFGSDPLASASLPLIEVGSGLFPDGAGLVDYPTMSFPRNKIADGVTFYPETSTDLRTWARSAEIVRAKSAQSGVDQMVFRSTISSAAAPQQFLRVHVEVK